MIFNSISKEINHQYPHTKHQKAEEYQNAHYVSSHTPNNYHHYNNIDYQVPQRESALSQMNQKITENLEYLKYKDYMRQKDLHSSRISNSSNHSRRSNRTLHSQANLNTHNHSRISLQSPSRSNHILTKKNEHYFPQFMQTKLSTKPWETKPTNLYQSAESGLLHREKSEYRQFLRKPITIDHYSDKYASTDKVYDNMQSINSNSKYSNPSRKEDYSTGREQFEMTQQTFASPINKDFITSFGKQSKLQKRVQFNSQNSSRPEKSSSRVVFKEEKDNLTKLSPLEVVPNTSNRTGLIVAAVLIGLGVLLLILQSIK